jgi:hypothetical protein
VVVVVMRPLKRYRYRTESKHRKVVVAMAMNRLKVTSHKLEAPVVCRSAVHGSRVGTGHTHRGSLTSHRPSRSCVLRMEAPRECRKSPWCVARCGMYTSSGRDAAIVFAVASKVSFFVVT